MTVPDRRATPADGLAVGIDVGGTKIAGGLVAGDGTVVHEQVVATPRGEGGADPGASATLGLVAQLEHDAHERGLAVLGIGVGVPEYVTPAGAIVSREVLDWDTATVARLGERKGLVVDSDVRAGARAERRLGRGRDVSSFLYVSVGTGISHTLVIGDELWSGHRGEALALGELPVAAAEALRPDAPLTLEQQASGGAIAALLRREPPPEREDALVRAGRLVAGALVTAVRLLDPERIVIGGGLGTSSGPFATALFERYRELGAGRPSPPDVCQSTLGNRGGMIGAGLLAVDVFATAGTVGADAPSQDR